MVKDRKNISSSSSKTCPHFFKVYLPHLSSQRLKIPTTFINNLNGVVPQKTILNGPLGRFWHVEVEKVEDDFFFQNGWQGFVKDCSLKLGEFLVFRYDANSEFDVKIFDNSGCEKEETLAYSNSEKMTCFVKEEAEPEARETFSKPTHGFKRKYSERSLKNIGKTSRRRSKRTASVKVKEDAVFEEDDFVEPNHPHFTAFVPSKPYDLVVQRVLDFSVLWHIPLEESGWRECSSCGKRLHCGRIASKSLLELLDNGGVECISCMKSLELSSIPNKEKPRGFSTTATDNVGVGSKMDGDGIDRGKLMQLGKNIEGNRWNRLFQSHNDDTNGSLGKIKREQVIPPIGEVGSTGFSNLNQASIGSSQFAKLDNSKETDGVKDMYESQSQTCLSGASLRTPTLELPLPGAVVEGREQSKIQSPYQQGQRSCHLFPKPPKMGPVTGTLASKDILPQIFVARPPVEGRGWNQLLPRYWPGIADQELQQISEDSNSTIVPLFEKVLSASDSGRIGRLVLPKACAEAYFPPLSQPEGLPLRIQDAKGKDWVFQFRFWPNNNSRLYVLEGVTPCIQSMQLQAGDTVTFSRVDPGGKLVLGFRKASNSLTLQEPPVFGKKTIFTVRPPGGQDQLAECDSCSKWRRLPVDVLLPPKWTCADNAWDLKRCVCSILDELNLKELVNLQRLIKDLKNERVAASNKPAQGTIAVLEDNGVDSGMPSVATTTKHPRHRSGCSCIVCSQSPRRKGPKHRPSCA